MGSEKKGACRSGKHGARNKRLDGESWRVMSSGVKVIMLRARSGSLTFRDGDDVADRLKAYLRGQQPFRSLSPRDEEALLLGEC